MSTIPPRGAAGMIDCNEASKAPGSIPTIAPPAVARKTDTLNQTTLNPNINGSTSSQQPLGMGLNNMVRIEYVREDVVNMITMLTYIMWAAELDSSSTPLTLQLFKLCSNIISSISSYKSPSSGGEHDCNVLLAALLLQQQQQKLHQQQQQQLQSPSQVRSSFQTSAATALSQQQGIRNPPSSSHDATTERQLLSQQMTGIQLLNQQQQVALEMTMRSNHLQQLSPHALPNQEQMMPARLLNEMQNEATNEQGQDIGTKQDNSMAG